MAAWHSLAGYLYLRPGGGRWKSRRRHWYVLDEETCQLLYYRSEAEATSPVNVNPSLAPTSSSKRPIGVIPLKNAAVSLVLEEDNQFIIHSEGKEYGLTADNHESMMIWVMALQAKREEKRLRDASHPPGLKGSDGMGGRGKASQFPCDRPFTRDLLEPPSGGSTRLFRTHSLQLQRRPAGSPPTRWWRSGTPPARQPSDGPTSPGPSTRHILDGLRLPLKEVTAETGPKQIRHRRHQEEPKKRPTPRRPPQSSSGSDDTSSSNGGESCPEVLELDAADHSPGRDGSSPDEVEPGDAKVRHLRHLNTSSATPDTTTTSSGVSSAPSGHQKERAGRSVSGASVSSDSAVGGGNSSGQCAHSLRVVDLEVELITVKAELTRALARETALRKRLHDEPDPEVKIRRRPLSGPDSLKSCGPGSPVHNRQQTQQQSEEQERILKNLNRFLNEEVLKLSRLLQETQQKQQAQNTAMSRNDPARFSQSVFDRKLDRSTLSRHDSTRLPSTPSTFFDKEMLQDAESSLEAFKRDYVFLMQSSLRISCAEGPEQQEVYLHGGRRHKERVLLLLDESRRRNPTLPVFDRCSPCLCHVDPLGFRHFLTDESLALHYICCQLHQHYSALSATVHQQRWKEYLRTNVHVSYLEPCKELKSLVRKGIPAPLRSRVWCLLFKARVQDLREAKGSHYYNNLCTLAPDSTVVAQHKRQIFLDLLRTMPNNIRFSDQNADGVRKMQEVLQAFCLHNPALGYCQGMNFLAGMCLLFMEPENAFWCLVAIAERYFPSGYFDLSLIGAQADQEVLKDMVREKLPALHRHLAALDIELCTVTLNWFLAIFFDVVPMETLLRIWDCFLLEGPKVLFRFSLAMLKLQESAILAKKDTVSVMRQLKSASKLAYDADALFQVAFEELEPFPRRKDIVAKQAYYYRCIQERNKKRETEKAAKHAKETLLSEPDRKQSCSGLGGGAVIECAAVFDKDKLWLVHGQQDGAQVSKVNCEESIMYRLNRQFDTRVMCMHALDDDVMLLGTLSHVLYGYSTRSRKLLWEVRLNDSILSLCSQQEDSVRQVFAGLADGTAAVVENIQGNEPKPDTFYILIGSNPVTCLCLVERRLWSACGNRMVILNARTLDSVDSFQTSCSNMDYISLVRTGQDGVWITLRGSSVLQLWDTKTLTCKLLFDIHTNAYAKWTKEDPSCPSLSAFWITSLLPLDGCVLVGTAEGSLIFYEIRPRGSGEPSTDTDMSNQPPEGDAEDAVDQVDIPFLRERNDSGCYSGTTALTLSRRASVAAQELLSGGGDSDATRETLYEDHSEEAATLKPSSSYSGADTIVSPGEPAWDEDITPDPEVVVSTEQDSCLPHIDEPEEVCRSLDLDSTPVRCYWRNTERIICKDLTESCSRLRACPQAQSRTFSSLLRDISKGSRRNRSVSLSDIRGRGVGGHHRGLALSADDLSSWLHGDSTGLSSSVTSGSYEFDDLLIPYTEDETGKGLPEFSLQDAELLIEMLRRQNGFSMVAKSEVTDEESKVSVTSSSPHANGNGEAVLALVDSWANLTCGETDNGSTSTNECSYDDASTPGVAEADTLLLSLPGHLKHLSSDTSSNLSTNSEICYVMDLVMQEKIKISDQPIKCLLKTRCGEELNVVSCAGCYGDDEAVLRWSREGSEKLWTNDPIVEVCPYTNTIRPSPFARSRMPRRGSLQPSPSPQMDTSVDRRCRSSTSAAPKVNMSHRLARVHSMFSRHSEKS